MKVMFLDESGDHSLDVIDPQYPVFVLAGVIMDEQYARTVAEQKLATFKQELFGRTDIILHTADITRNQNGFERMKEPEFRQRFYEKLNALMRELQYEVVACVIKKDEHFERYGLWAVDPYMLSLHVLVERFCFDIGFGGSPGRMVAEKRNPTLDHQLELAFLNLKVSGTRFLQATQIERRIEGLVTRGKEQNLAGLQIADLVASPIGRYVIGKKTREDFRIVESKFRRNWRSGGHQGFGLVVLPKR